MCVSLLIKRTTKYFYFLQIVSNYLTCSQVCSSTNPSLFPLPYSSNRNQRQRRAGRPGLAQQKDGQDSAERATQQLRQPVPGASFGGFGRRQSAHRRRGSPPCRRSATAAAAAAESEAAALRTVRGFR